MLCLLELFFDSSKTYLSKNKKSLFEVNDSNNRRGGGGGGGERRWKQRVTILNLNKISCSIYFTATEQLILIRSNKFKITTYDTDKDSYSDKRMILPRGM